MPGLKLSLGCSSRDRPTSASSPHQKKKKNKKKKVVKHRPALAAAQHAGFAEDVDPPCQKACPLCVPAARPATLSNNNTSQGKPMARNRARSAKLHRIVNAQGACRLFAIALRLLWYWSLFQEATPLASHTPTPYSVFAKCMNPAISHP